MANQKHLTKLWSEFIYSINRQQYSGKSLLNFSLEEENFEMERH